MTSPSRPATRGSSCRTATSSRTSPRSSRTRSSRAATCRWCLHRSKNVIRHPCSVGTDDGRRMTDDDYEDPMPKQKSKRALRKRVKLTGTGRLRRYHAYKSHILTKKHPKRKRHLRKPALVSHADERRLKRLLMA